MLFFSVNALPIRITPAHYRTTCPPTAPYPEFFEQPLRKTPAFSAACTYSFPATFQHIDSTPLPHSSENIGGIPLFRPISELALTRHSPSQTRHSPVKPLRSPN